MGKRLYINRQKYHPCEMRECSCKIPYGQFFCEEHTSLVSQSTKAQLLQHFTPGQFERNAEVKPEYVKALEQARSEIQQNSQNSENKPCPFCKGSLIKYQDEYRCNSCSYYRPNFTAPRREEPKRMPQSNGREFTADDIMPFGKYGPTQGDPRPIRELPTHYLRYMVDNLSGEKSPGLYHALETELSKRAD